MKQNTLFEYYNLKSVHKAYGRTTHGGASSRGHRKLERPLSTTRPMHLVLRSQHASGAMSFLSARNKGFVEKTLRQKAKKFGVRIEQLANVGNHLHLKIRILSREMFQKFLKSVTTLIARFITGARKGMRFGRFWQGLAYTRVLTSNLEERYLREYIAANQLEAMFGKVARELHLQFQRYIYKERKKSKFLRVRIE